ncbi:hypothetical protein OFR22_03960 [Brachyspira hyodysenteriae]|uniref:Uncharacterized protein n=1 Tax=Brachyspira hyodysenteriae (strain ATCC 49526 / WA1) TaxID=565034 RepID=A0A3B6VH12_BRAHW|nr:hypothetical protein [Brachyspira hyodysenteriae]ACN84474.1 hypothetical protein BHWA1_02015 [Brachyspira hyodysenteriae WA1]AUJ50207.1 hypothetical protein BH718_01773 [Brachyspira hyodysenteriae]MBT8719508.1 hypothetical protein [Brachyspira hyodysenteriae]MBT8729747.1 hypothetical protein [Brachyspira hyodysenteriae]MBT8731916.1 hypothetical protein [Brachyspira hyodysenteriae]
MMKYLNSLNNNYNDSVIFNDDDYNSLIEEYNDIIKNNTSEQENDNL